MMPLKETARGQSFAEYAVLIGVVTAAILGMQLYAKRGLQASVKMAADQLSPFRNEAGGDPGGEKAQVAAVRYESRERQNKAVADIGTVLTIESASRTASNRQQDVELAADGGQTRSLQADTSGTSGDLPARGTGVSSYSEVVVFKQ